MRVYALVLFVGAWDPAGCSERLALCEDQGCWRFCPGSRPLTPITGWLACAMPRIRISDEVDPSARQKWPRDANSVRVVRGVKGVESGVTLC